MFQRVYVLLVCLLCVLSVGAEDIGLASIKKLGFHITEGQTPGYIDDPVCGTCHTDIYQAYQGVGKAHSFYPAKDAAVIEDFSTIPFYHENSRRYFEISEHNGVWMFKRYQKTATGRFVNEFTREIDWVIGSGNTQRIYLVSD